MRVRILIGLVLVFLWGCNSLCAQQEPVYSQYMSNMLAINPAYAGSHGVPEFTALYRRQWLGIPGAPATSTLGINLPTRNSGWAFGIQFVNDAIGIQKTNAISTSFCYRTHLFNEEDAFSVGLLGSMTNFRANYNMVDLVQPNDPSFTGQVINAYFPNLGGGIFYHSTNFYFGLSAPSLLTNTIDGTAITVGARSAASNALISHFFLTAGVVLPLNEDLVVKPSFLLKAVPGVPVSTDINTNVWIKNVLGIGASYRIGSSFVGIAEIQVTPKFRIGYSYDRDISSLGKFTLGAHELILKFELPNHTDDGGYRSPRYF